MVVLLQIWFVLAVIAAWLATVVAVLCDARARVANPAASRAAAALAAGAPFLGAVTWLLIRPPETLLDRRERRLALALVEDVWHVRPPAPEPASTPAADAPEPTPAVDAFGPAPTLVQAQELVA